MAEHCHHWCLLESQWSTSLTLLSDRRGGGATAWRPFLQLSTPLVGLYAAHEQMIIHRDVKASNLMLTLSPDGHVQVRILDLGVAISRGLDCDRTLTEEG